MYDFEKLSCIIEARRKRFKLFIVLYVFMLIIGISLLFFKEKTLAFFGIVILILTVVFLAKLIQSYSPVLLFSKEKRGVLIKEHEYVANIKRGLSARATVVRQTGATHSTSGNAKSRRPHVRSAYVYIREKNGDVLIIDGLSSLHTDIYEIGDELLRPSGARYPVILNRKAEKQPCPFCGRINDMNSFECSVCGLSIIKK